MSKSFDKGVRLIRNLLAVLGALTLLAGVAIVIFRKPLLERVLQNALKGAGLHVDPIAVTKVGVSEVVTGPVKLSWEGQSATIQSIHVPLTSVFPPRLGVIEITGTEVTLQPQLLLKRDAPASSRTPADEQSAPVGELLAALEGVKADVRVRLGRDPDSVLDALLQLKTAGPGFAGDLRTKGVGVDSSVPLKWDVAASEVVFGPTKTSIDLSKALSMVRLWLPGELSQFEAQGVVDLTIEGSAGKGPLFAKGHTHLRGGSVTLKDLSLTVAGIDAMIAWSSLLDVKTEEAQQIRISSAEVGKVAFENTVIAFTLLGPNEFRLNSLETKAFGGTIRFSSTNGTIDPLDVTLELSVENVDIAQLTTILPPHACHSHGTTRREGPVRATQQSLVPSRR